MQTSFSETTPADEPRYSDELTELDRRIARPQRHRLLQGYPMAPLMGPPREVAPPEPSDRELIVGVLPHPFCNPTVEGCGFCTFPHQKYHRTTSARVVDAVLTEIADRLAAQPGLHDRRVPAVYVGGGTANLVAPDIMRRLYETLMSAFDLREAELSLEGAPRYFLTRDHAHLDLLADLDVGHRRVSMGVQTFDERWLARMGRMAMGAPAHVEAVVGEARARGITTSCDLLYNLPGQRRAAMLADVERAAKLGFDQICVYHLVMFHGLDTKWSKDRDMLRALPSNEAAAANWLAIRERLFELGYTQSTLTNFERRDLPRERRFRYEQLSFQPQSTDGLGFGPAGLTTFSADRGPWKTMNFTDASRYIAAVDRGEAPLERAFRYAVPDQRLLHLTRQIPRLEMRRDTFRAQFGLDPYALYRPEIEALVARELVEMGQDAIRLTPVGMFYADSIAGLIAWRRVGALRRNPQLNDAEMHFMG